MVQLGVRIELYENVGPVDEPSRNYLGALSRDDGHEGATVPAVGDHLSTMTLRAGTLEAVPQLRGDASTFLRARRVEHVLRPVRDGKTATWSGWDTPITVLVLHSPYDIPTDPQDTTWTADLLRRYAADGWTVDVDPRSPLYPASAAVRAFGNSAEVVAEEGSTGRG
ncbi:hypothetical protein [Embleya sp. NPDC005971]|uniref:hypothetical protein n=1 Tax=Embleya sp. NPDC005971 TaxID=3156724 RepID=UPI0033E7FC8E